MSITVTWLEGAPRTVHMAFKGHWTWEEYIKAVDHVTALANEAGGPIVHISDFTASQSLPSHAIGRMQEISDTLAARRDTTRLSIIVGADQVVTKLLQVFSHLYIELAYFDTLEEALTFLREEDLV